MSVIKMSELELNNKRVLIREDLNVPIKNGAVSSDARLRAALPTIKSALASGAKLMVMSHLGRPVEGGSEEENADYTLAPVAAYLSEALGQEVPLIKDYLHSRVEVDSGCMVLLENVRFNSGEKKDERALAKAYADLW